MERQLKIPTTARATLLRRIIDRDTFGALRADKGVNSRGSGKGVQGAAVRAVCATDGPGRHFHQEPFHDGRGFVRRHGSDHRATFVAGDIRLVAADLDDQAAAAVYVHYILVGNDWEA